MSVSKVLSEVMKVLPGLRRAQLTHHLHKVTELQTQFCALRQQRSERFGRGGLVTDTDTDGARTRSDIKAGLNKINSEFSARKQLLEIYKPKDDDLVSIGRGITVLRKNEKGLPLLCSLMDDLDMLYISLVHMYFGVHCRGCSDEDKIKSAEHSLHLLVHYLAFDPGVADDPDYEPRVMQILTPSLRNVL